MTFNMNDYVDVKERIKLFIEAYPEGSIQFEFKGILESNPDMIWGVAYAYRSADDTRPGVGTAAELAIGKTTFTRGSELMNLETSAWGRAIAALGIGLGKSVATVQEVTAAKARQGQSDDPWQEKRPIPVAAPTPEPPSDEMTQKQYNLIKSLFNWSFQDMTAYVDDFKIRHHIPADEKLNKKWAMALITELQQNGYVATPKRKYDQESKAE